MSKYDLYDVSTIRARSSVHMLCDHHDRIRRNQNEVLILLIFLLVPIRAFNALLQETHYLYIYRANDNNKRDKCQRNKMSVRVSILILILTLAISFILLAPQNSVRQVIFVFRHGDRTPTESYPNDPYRDYKWPGGWGALTKEGMIRMYNIGQWIRNEYGSIIGNKYESDLSFTQSTYADRCIMSAQVLLAALYPPNTEEIFVPGLMWHPVPVHSIPRHLDKTIVVKAPCPRLEKALKEAYANESKRPESPSAEYFQELSNYTAKNISTITDVEFLYNILEIEERNGLKLPAWTNKYYNQQMREIAARSLAIFTSNTLQQRLRGGPLLKEIFERLHAFNDGQDTRRTYLYSAHDITLVNLLRTMGFTNEYFKPDYGSTLIFELHAASNSADAELKLMYLNDTETLTLYHMNIPKCGTPCRLKTLTKLWKDVLPENWDDECLLL